MRILSHWLLLLALFFRWGNPALVVADIVWLNLLGVKRVLLKIDTLLISLIIQVVLVGFEKGLGVLARRQQGTNRTSILPSRKVFLQVQRSHSNLIEFLSLHPLCDLYIIKEVLKILVLHRCVKLRLVMSGWLISEVPPIERIVHVLAVVVDHNLALPAVMRVGSYFVIIIYLILSFELVILRGVWHWAVLILLVSKLNLSANCNLPLAILQMETSRD